MKSRRKILITATVLLVGGFGAPFVSLPTGQFGWQLFAQVYQADLEIVKTSDVTDPLQFGSQFNYTLTVTNNGPSNATGVVVDDALPDGVDYLSDTCGGTYTAITHTWSWSIGGLAAGSQVSCDILVQVSTGQAGSLLNAVVVTGNEPDDTPGNNSSSTVVQAQETPIPVLTRSGIAVLILTVVVLTVVILRRRGPPV